MTGAALVLALYALTALLRGEAATVSVVLTGALALATWSWWDPSAGAFAVAVGVGGRRAGGRDRHRSRSTGRATRTTACWAWRRGCRASTSRPAHVAAGLWAAIARDGA